MGVEIAGPARTVTAPRTPRLTPAVHRHASGAWRASSASRDPVPVLLLPHTTVFISTKGNPVAKHRLVNINNYMM